jgi:hypothetical protein
LYAYFWRHVVYDEQHHHIAFVVVGIRRAVFVVSFEVGAPFVVEFLLGEHCEVTEKRSIDETSKYRYVSSTVRKQ